MNTRKMTASCLLILQFVVNTAIAAPQLPMDPNKTETVPGQSAAETQKNYADKMAMMGKLNEPTPVSEETSFHQEKLLPQRPVWKIQAMVSPSSPDEKFNLEIYRDNTALIMISGQGYRGVYDPASGTVHFEIRGFEDGSLWTIHVMPKNPAKIISFEKLSYSMIGTSKEASFYDQLGHITKVETSYKNIYSEGKSVRRYTYVDIQGKTRVASESVGGWNSSTENVLKIDGATAGSKSRYAGKTYYLYNNDGTEKARFAAGKSKEPGKDWVYYASYGIWEGQRYIKAGTTDLAQDLTHDLNPGNAKALVDQYARLKSVSYYLKAGDFSGYRFTIQEIKNAQGVFVPKAVLTPGSFLYLVVGTPDVLSGEMNDIKVLYGQKAINDYSVFYGEGYEYEGGMNGPSKSVYKGYGLVFSKWGALSDGTWGNTVVVVDYPSQKTVVLDGKTYKVSVDAAGAIILGAMQAGDVNGNGRWDSADSTLVRRHIDAVKKGLPSPLTAEQQAAADVDGDSKVTFSDLQVIRGLITQVFTAEDLPVILGDSNRDGRWDSADSTLIRRHLDAIKAGEPSPLTAKQQFLADLDGDGKVTFSDLQVIRGLIGQVFTAEDLPVVLGDPNGDGRWDSPDATLIRRHLDAIKAGEASPMNAKQQFLADVDGDGKVTFSDLQVIRGLIAQVFTAEDLPVVLGDPNGDGRWDSPDATLIQRHLDAIKAGKASPMNAKQQFLADVDGDGKVTFSDLQVIRGLIGQVYTLEDLPVIFKIAEIRPSPTQMLNPAEMTQTPDKSALTVDKNQDSNDRYNAKKKFVIR